MEKSDQTVYFGISKSNRIHFDKEVEIVRNSLKKYNISLSVFVDKYEFTLDQEKQMMNLAFEEIDQCFFVIVELTKKAIGVGVEVGYAKAKNKSIIYLKRKNAKHSTTVGGSADYIIEYNDKDHLKFQLEATLKLLMNKLVNSP